MNELAEKIIKEKDLKSATIVSALFDIGRNDDDLDLIRKSLNLCRKNIKYRTKNNSSKEEIVQWHNLYKKMLLFASPYDFDSYLLYLEMQRPPEQRFYYPRRKVLLEVVRAMQMLVDDELDELVISMPPRIGKSTLLLMFVTWVIGKYPEKSNLYSAFSDSITTAFYNGLLEVLQDSTTYLWNDVFPNSHIVDTNASAETIDINRKKRYKSITCRSLSGTLNGACDCNGLLISDDLIGSIDEALKKSRLDSAWSKVDNNLIPRAKETAKKLWVGTRWSIADPTGRRIELLENSKEYKNIRFKIINLPALNEKGESNFDYMYNVGFSTEYFKQRQASYEKNNDLASWLAEYMGEPIERQGVLFTVDTMKFYNGTLPADEIPDRIYAYCDTAFGGIDYTCMPVAYQYGERVFIHDCVFDNSDKTVTEPKVAGKIIKHNISTVQFEYNNGGQGYADDVSERVKAAKKACNITGSFANTHKRKEDRIYQYAPEIREFYYRDESCRDKEYQAMMNNLFSFSIEGKNKNDDAPDSLAGLAEMSLMFNIDNVVIMKRPF